MAAAFAGGALLLAGCSSAATTGATTGATAGSSSTGAGTGNSAPVTVRLGFLTNITHASALVGLKQGFFTQDLGSAGTLKPTAFASGTQETTALLAGQLDAAYVGPNPAINAWSKSGGTAIKVISGAATGGASVVVKAGTTGAAQLKGKTLTTPNSAAVLEFKSGQIAGGSEPAPYDVEMVSDGGTVLLSEPGVTTLLVVTQTFLTAHPAVVADLLKAQIQANDYIKNSTAAAETAANDELAAYTGKPLKASVVAASFKEITFTNDPDESSLTADATQATSLGLLKTISLNGLWDLGPLNTALQAAGEPAVGS
jgi:NitT/TauT family transport system substrate-binding protein